MTAVSNGGFTPVIYPQSTFSPTEGAVIAITATGAAAEPSSDQMKLEMMRLQAKMMEMQVKLNEQKTATAAPVSVGGVHLVLETNQYALHDAAKAGNLQMLQMLLTNEMYKGFVNSTDKQGRTPLNHVAECRSKDAGAVASLLIQAGANVHFNNSLCLAAWSNQPDVCGFLLKAGASVHAKSSVGDTPLNKAAFGFSRNEADIVKVIELLIKAGADVNAIEKDSGWSVLKRVGYNKGAARQLLINAGAVEKGYASNPHACCIIM